MKVIFLDIDGVLNSEEWLDSEECALNRYIKIDGVPCRNDINEEHVKNLKDIVDHTGAKIVLCSTWRHIAFYHSPSIHLNHTLNHILNKYGLSIMDKIGNTKPPSFIRPKEIKCWLDNHADVESFVILDDDYNHDEYDMYGIAKHLVQTQFYGKDGGLQLSHVSKAIKILENDWG